MAAQPRYKHSGVRGVGRAAYIDNCCDSDYSEASRYTRIYTFVRLRRSIATIPRRRHDTAAP